MKAIYYKVVCTLALLFALTGCMHNNGNIGPWFGQWKVERLTIDGKDDPDYAGNAFFRFQSSVFSICVSNPEQHVATIYYGTWEEKGNYVDAWFNTENKDIPPFLGKNDMEKLGEFYIKGYNCFRVIENNHKTKILEYLDEETGVTYTYYLKKW